MRRIRALVVLCAVVACVAWAGAGEASCGGSASALPTIEYNLNTGGPPTCPGSGLVYKHKVRVIVHGVPKGEVGSIVIHFEDRKLYENIDVKQYLNPTPVSVENVIEPEYQDVSRDYLPRGDWLVVRVTRTTKGASGTTETELWKDEFAVRDRLAVTAGVGAIFTSLEDEDKTGHRSRRAPLSPATAITIFNVQPEGGGTAAYSAGFSAGDHQLYYLGLGWMFGNDTRVVPSLDFLYGQVDRANADKTGTETRWKTGWGASVLFVVAAF